MQVFLKVFMSAAVRGWTVADQDVRAVAVSVAMTAQTGLKCISSIAFGNPDRSIEASASGNANEDTACYSQSP